MGPFDLSFFRAIIFLTSIAWVFHMISSRGTIVLRLYKGNKYSVLFFLVWFLYAALTLTWVKDYLGWMRAMYFLGLGLICIVVYSSMLETQGDIQTTFRLMTIMAGFHNVIGWYESLAGNYLFLRIDRVERYLMTGRPVSTFRNTNDFATFMLFSVFIAYVCLANSKSMKGKCFYATIMFSSGALVFRTLSRANILGLLVAILVFVGLSMKKPTKICH